MFYLRIGESGEYLEVKNKFQAAEIYAKYDGYDTILVQRLGEGAWEVMSVNSAGDARFKHFCKVETKEEAKVAFYQSVLEKMEADKSTSLLEESEYLNAVLF